MAWEHEKTLQRAGEMLALARRTDAPKLEGEALKAIGGVELALGRYPQAIRHLDQALARLGTDPRSLGALHTLAQAYLALGDTERSLEAIGRAEELAASGKI